MHYNVFNCCHTQMHRELFTAEPNSNHAMSRAENHNIDRTRIMATFQEYLINEGYASFAEAKKLEEEGSKSDPEEEPFRSKYKAREKYGEIKQALKGYMNENENDSKLKNYMAVVDLHLAMNYVDTEELSEGEEHFLSCLSLLEDRKCTNDVVNVYQMALNHSGILYSGRQNYGKSLENLKLAEDLYKKFKQDVGSDPVSVDEFFKDFSSEENRDIATVSNNRSTYFEDTYTHTLYYIAQVYALTDKREESAKYCHVTLQRQLDANKYQPDEWALNAATLSQYYLTVDVFHFARHCLASASLIFEEAARKEDMNEDEKEDIKEKRANIDRCWAKYGIALLETSKEYLINEDIAEDHNADKENTTQDVTTQDDTTQDDTTQDATEERLDVDDVGNSKAFPRFNIEVTWYEDQITDKFVKDFSEAREVFLSTQTRLNNAKEYFVEDGHCSDYIQIIQDLSKCYKELAFFELDMERQCKMHKRRVDLLKETVTDLNPQHYLLVCRQLMFELAETYSTMVDLKLSIMEAEGIGPTPHSVKKINTLARQSIGQYTAYLDSLKGGKPEFPEEFPDNDLRPALVAMFCMGRLYSRIIEPAVPVRIALIRKTLECYQFIDTYCRRFPAAERKVANELDICREMIVLLPMKIEKVGEGQL